MAAAHCPSSAAAASTPALVGAGDDPGRLIARLARTAATSPSARPGTHARRRVSTPSPSRAFRCDRSGEDAAVARALLEQLQPGSSRSSEPAADEHREALARRPGRRRLGVDAVGAASVENRPRRQRTRERRSATADRYRSAAAESGRRLQKRLGPGADDGRHAHRIGPVAVVPPDPIAAPNRTSAAPIGDSIPLT